MVGLDPNHPGRAKGVTVDALRRIWKRVIGGEDGARDRHVEITRGLDGLDDPKGLPRVEVVASSGQLDEGDVAEAVLGEVGDADGERPVRFRTNPFVVFGIPQGMRDC